MRLPTNVFMKERKRLTNDIVMTLDLVAEQYRLNSYDRRDLVELNRVLLDLILEAEYAYIARYELDQCVSAVILNDKDEWYS